MIFRFLSSFSHKRSADPYSHLPEEIRNEISNAMEATSRYDIF